MLAHFFSICLGNLSVHLPFPQFTVVYHDEFVIAHPHQQRQRECLKDLAGGQRLHLLVAITQGKGVILNEPSIKK